MLPVQAPRRAKGRRGAGFTLVELVLVLAIISVLSALIMPSVATAVRRTGLESTANRLRELLDFAYASSISRRRTVLVAIDPQRRLCWTSVRETVLPWLAEAGEEPGARKAGARKAGTRPLASMEIPRAIDVVVFRAEGQLPAGGGAATAYTIAFSSDGTAEDAVIELADDRGGRVALEVIGATGEVVVRERAGRPE